jgi:hypothetical protein
MEMTALFEFTSHVDGKNAKVQIFPDRVEWAKPGKVSLTRLTGASMTLGASLVATGIRTGGSAEMIAVKNITSVLSSKDGLRFHKVVITASGNTIEFRVDKAVADAARVLISQLILGSHPSQLRFSNEPTVVAETVAVKPAEVVPPVQGGDGSSDRIAKLKELKSLLDDGILSPEEFEAEKRKVLDS